MQKSTLISIVAATAASLFSFTGFGQANRTETLAETNSALVETASGGFNPNFIGITVSVDVQVGSNSCFAKGIASELVESKDIEGNIILTPILFNSISQTDFMCPMQFLPVFQTASISLQIDQTKNISVFVRNMGDFGQNSLVYTNIK